METRNVFVVNRCVVGSNYAIKRDLRENNGFKSIIGRVGPLFWLLGLMQIASRLELEVTSNDAAPLADLIVGMRVTSGTKNPYHIYFPKTDPAGRSLLDRAAIVGQFKDHWEQGLMDFNGTLESASQTVTLFLFNAGDPHAFLANALAWPLLKHEQTVWASRQDWADYFLSCHNNQCSLPETTTAIPLDGPLRVEVYRREA